MARCAGFKPDGTPCERIVKASQTFCFSHDPSRSEERRRNATKAGRSKPNTELAGIKVRLSDLADDVLAGLVDRGDAAVAGQLLNTYLRGLEIERRTFDMADLMSRLEGLERQADHLKGA